MEAASDSQTEGCKDVYKIYVYSLSLKQLA